MVLASLLNRKSRATPTTPMTRTAKITLVRERLFHSFHTKYPSPRDPKRASAGTMATQALPMEILNPATIVGPAAGRITFKTFVGVGSLNEILGHITPPIVTVISTLRSRCGHPLRNRRAVHWNLHKPPPSKEKRRRRNPCLSREVFGSC